MNLFFQIKITVTSELIEENEFTIVVNTSAYESLKHEFQLQVPVTSDTDVMKNVSGKHEFLILYNLNPVFG